MRFTQIVSHEGLLFALGDYGQPYVRRYKDVPTGQFEYDEYGARSETMKRTFYWELDPAVADKEEKD